VRGTTKVNSVQTRRLDGGLGAWSLLPRNDKRNGARGAFRNSLDPSWINLGKKQKKTEKRDKDMDRRGGLISL